MTTKYNVGDVIPIGFKIKSISIDLGGVHYHLESENKYWGSVISVPYVSEEEIDKELEHEN